MSRSALAGQPRRPGRPSDADSAVTRERILSGARAAFAANGYDATTNKMVAEAAGLTAAALYHYFPSKADLYRAASEAVYERLTGIIRSANLDGVSLTRRLESVVAMVDAAHAQDPSVVAFIVGLNEEARRHPEIAATVHPAQIGLVTEVVSLVRNAPDCDEVLGHEQAETFADLFLGALAGLARLSSRTGDPRRLGGPMALLVDLTRRAR